MERYGDHNDYRQHNGHGGEYRHQGPGEQEGRRFEGGGQPGRPGGREEYGRTGREFDYNRRDFDDTRGSRDFGYGRGHDAEGGRYGREGRFGREGQFGREGHEYGRDAQWRGEGRMNRDFYRGREGDDERNDGGREQGGRGFLGTGSDYDVGRGSYGGTYGTFNSPEYMQDYGRYGQGNRFNEDAERRRQPDRSRSGGEQFGREQYGQRQTGGRQQRSQFDDVGGFGPYFGKGIVRGALLGRGRFSGKGPKGYSRTDEQLKEEICRKLYEHPEIDASDVTVEVKGGELMLTGTIDSRHARDLIEDEADRVMGIKEVNNQIRIKREAGMQGQGAMHSPQTGMSGQQPQGSQGMQAAGKEGKKNTTASV